MAKLAQELKIDRLTITNLRGSPDLVDRELSIGLLLIVASLVLVRAEIAQRGVQPTLVVEHLDVVEEASTSI